MSAPAWDVVVVGGGPAGLAAALVLGRALKRTLLVDGATPRNASAAHVHGFPGHDGRAPAELREAMRSDLARYEIEIRRGTATSLGRASGGVTVEIDGRDRVQARRVLLACGVIDVLPKLPGVRELWGRSVFSCPYCHGHEHRRRGWGLLASTRAVVSIAPLYRSWTDDVIVFLNGRTDVEPTALAALRDRGIAIEPRAVRSLLAREGALEAIELEDGERIARGAMLVHPAQRQTDLVLFAGLALQDGGVRVSPSYESSMERVHVAGDAAHDEHPQALMAAASGAKAALALVELLTFEDLRG